MQASNRSRNAMQREIQNTINRLETITGRMQVRAQDAIVRDEKGKRSWKEYQQLQGFMGKLHTQMGHLARDRSTRAVAKAQSSATKARLQFDSKRGLINVEESVKESYKLSSSENKEIETFITDIASTWTPGDLGTEIKTLKNVKGLDPRKQKAYGAKLLARLRNVNAANSDLIGDEDLKYFVSDILTNVEDVPDQESLQREIDSEVKKARKDLEMGRLGGARLSDRDIKAQERDLKKRHLQLTNQIKAAEGKLGSRPSDIALKNRLMTNKDLIGLFTRCRRFSNNRHR